MKQLKVEESNWRDSLKRKSFFCLSFKIQGFIWQTGCFFRPPSVDLFTWHLKLKTLRPNLFSNSNVLNISPSPQHKKVDLRWPFRFVIKFHAGHRLWISVRLASVLSAASRHWLKYHLNIEKITWRFFPYRPRLIFFSMKSPRGRGLVWLSAVFVWVNGVWEDPDGTVWPVIWAKSAILGKEMLLFRWGTLSWPSAAGSHLLSFPSRAAELKGLRAQLFICFRSGGNKITGWGLKEIGGELHSDCVK